MAASRDGDGAGRRRSRASSRARTGMMPDLRGLSAREALRTLAAVGLTASISGNGFVVEQSPRRAACSRPTTSACSSSVSARPRRAGDTQ